MTPRSCRAACLVSIVAAGLTSGAPAGLGAQARGGGPMPLDLAFGRRILARENPIAVAPDGSVVAYVVHTPAEKSARDSRDLPNGGPVPALGTRGPHDRRVVRRSGDGALLQPREQRSDRRDRRRIRDGADGCGGRCDSAAQRAANLPQWPLGGVSLRLPQAARARHGVVPRSRGRAVEWRQRTSHRRWPPAARWQLSHRGIRGASDPPPVVLGPIQLA